MIGKTIIYIIILTLTIAGATAQKTEPITDGTLINISKPTIVETYGAIAYKSDIETTKTPLELSLGTTITKNRIKIDEANYPELNKPATLTFYNTGLKKPITFRNGKWQPEIKPIKVGISDYRIDVTGFSEYTLNNVTQKQKIRGKPKK